MSVEIAVTGVLIGIWTRLQHVPVSVIAVLIFCATAVALSYWHLRKARGDIPSKEELKEIIRDEISKPLSQLVDATRVLSWTAQHERLTYEISELESAIAAINQGVREADEWVSRIRANVGGTNVEEAMGRKPVAKLMDTMERLPDVLQEIGVSYAIPSFQAPQLVSHPRRPGSYFLPEENEPYFRSVSAYQTAAEALVQQMWKRVRDLNQKKNRLGDTIKAEKRRLGTSDKWP